MFSIKNPLLIVLAPLDRVGMRFYKNISTFLEIHFIVLFLASYLLSGCKKNIQSDANPAGTFIKFYGGQGNQTAGNVLIVADGYVVTGTSNSYSNDTADVVLYKTDQDGNQQWYKNYGGPKIDSGKYVIPTTDGGYAIAGSYTNPNGKPMMYLVKSTANGDTMWTKKYGFSGSETSVTTEGRGICLNADGGYTIIGSSVSTLSPYKEMYMVRTDAAGNNNVWTTIANYGLTGYNTYGNVVFPSPDGGFDWCGNTSIQNGGQTPVISRFFSNGGINFAYLKTEGRINQPALATGEYMIKTNDGGYVIVGTTINSGPSQSDIYMLKLDATQSTVWYKTYGTAGADYGTGVTQTSDGGYALTGAIGGGNTNGGLDIALIKTDATGNSTWTRNFGYTGNDLGRCVLQTSDGGYIVSGTVNFSSNNMICLIKTNALGNLTQ